MNRRHHSSSSVGFHLASSCDIVFVVRPLKQLLLFIILAIAISSTSAMAVAVKQVAVIGATGRLGRLTVQQLVDRGIACKILCRPSSLPSSSSSSSSSGEKKNDEIPKTLTDATTSAQVAAYLESLPNVSIVKGDIGNTKALEELVQDCDACIAVYGATRKTKLSDLWNHVEDSDPTHAKQINYIGVQNLVQACSNSNCKRIVRITGKGEDPNGIFSILINLLGSMAKAWNYEGERVLRSSNIDYTIIRPGIMSEEGPGTDYSLALADDGGDLPVAKIKYSDIATLCIDCLEYDNAARTTLTAMTKETTTTKDDGGFGDAKESIKSWKPLLETVQPDRRTFPDDMLQQHYTAVRNFVVKLGGVSVVVFAILVKIVLF